MAGILYRIAAVSDGHINYETANEGYHSTAANVITDLDAGRPVDAVLYVGDTSQNTAAHADVATHFFDNLPTGIPSRVAYGNHEYIDSSEWSTWYGHETDDAFTIGEVGILTVQSATDASDGHESSTQAACPDLTFIQNTLDNWETDSTVKSVIVNCHVRPWDENWASHGSGNSNCTAVRDEFERGIVDCVFTGHSHTENTLIHTNTQFNHDPGQWYAFTPHLGDRNDGGREQVRVLDVYETEFEHRAIWDNDTTFETETISHTRSFDVASATERIRHGSEWIPPV